MKQNTVITLIRHGETVDNLTAVLQGHYDSELDDVGLAQAGRVAERLTHEGPFDVFYCSDLKRAAVTAQVISRAIGQEPIATRELREWHLGVLEHRPVAELWKEYPVIMQSFCSAGDDLEVPGGESRRQFRARITAFVRRILAEHEGKRILVVTHGGVLRAFFRYVLEIPETLNIKPMVSNVGFSRFTFNGEDWTMNCWNDTSHLYGMTLTDPKAY